MVASKLWEVANKGGGLVYGAASSSSSVSSGPPTTIPVLGTSPATLDSSSSLASSTNASRTRSATPPEDSSSSSYWNQASDGLQFATDATYSTLAGLLTSVYSPRSTAANGHGNPASPLSSHGDGTLIVSSSSSSAAAAAAAASSVAGNTTAAASTSSMSSTSFDSGMGDQQPTSRSWTTLWNNNNIHQNKKQPPKQKIEAVRKLTQSDLAWIFDNPYQSVRGRHHRRESITAVRSFITVLPHFHEEQDPADTTHVNFDDDEDDDAFASTTFAVSNDESVLMDVEESWHEPPPNQGAGATAATTTTARRRTPHAALSASNLESSETAAHLAEGTLRALRDLALDEAVDLNFALRFWAARWERPLLSWMEAGPLVWTDSHGYNHRLIGRKVAQLQAVLARRCAAIGELQQHLLRAGWQKGVAQWGVLGHGGHWATVAGFDGSIPTEETTAAAATTTTSNHDGDGPPLPPPPLRSDPSTGDLAGLLTTIDEPDGPEPMATTESQQTSPDPLPPSPSKIGVGSEPGVGIGKERAHVFVRRRDGGGIFLDEPAFLAQWTIDAIKLVRRHLFRAANGLVPLPHASNWERVDTAGAEDIIRETAPASGKPLIIPVWAGVGSTGEPGRGQPRITDLSTMTEEVAELLNMMEDVMGIQRQRRLDKLKPTSWIRRNWYVVSVAVPTVWWLVRSGKLGRMAKFIVSRVRQFFREQLLIPISAIADELLKGRESFSDKKARMETITVLQKMIKSWLDEYFPDMPEKQRQRLADEMDVSLVERTKEESMKSFYEINNVVRMSFIEMQWLKKEMMNALHAMDEVMSANDINMNIAAITPVAMFLYVNARFFRFLFSLLNLGRTREETFSTFRTIILDIERLLVMRDNPPNARGDRTSVASENCALGADDLGMLMLLIHECRRILWHDRRRFSRDIIRSVTEDLAELAGERGAVSVKQQLQIISRMCRSYPFMKVISIGHDFHYSTIRLA